MEIKFDIIEALGLDSNIVTEFSYKYAENGNLILFIRINEPDYCCPYCHSKNKRIKEYREVTLKGLKVGLHQCILKVKYPKYLCTRCNRYFSRNTSPISYYKLIPDCFKSILESFKKMRTFKDIAEDHSVPRSTVMKVFDNHVEDFSVPIAKGLSFDEFKNLNTEDNMFAFVAVDLFSAKIVKILKSRKKTALEEYFASIPLETREKVEVVTCDMYRPYILLAQQYFPKAIIAVDPFHYIRYLTSALQDIRRRVSEKPNLPSLLERICAHPKLLTLSLDELKEKGIPESERVELEDKICRAVELNADLHVGYQQYQIFIHAFHTAKNKKEGIACVNDFLKDNRKSFIPEYREVCKTRKNFLKFIHNSFIWIDGKKLTNGTMEGVNRRIKTLKNLSAGYKDSDRFFKRVTYIINSKN